MRIWITWELQRRNKTVSRQVNAVLYELDIKGNRFVRYFICIVKTCLRLAMERPSSIFAQSPSLILAVLAVNWGKLFRIPVIIDAHNAGLIPSGRIKTLSNMLIRHILRRSSLVIVSNDNLTRYVDAAGGNAFVLPDPIPKLEGRLDRVELKGKYNILFICTYASDEPYVEVVKAAARIDKNIYVYITGNPKGREEGLKTTLPPNVILTGFLPESEYLKFLHSVDAVLVLTTREDCLMCGAYEGVAAEKPLIVSDTKALRGHFSKGTIYSHNEASDIALKIQAATTNLEKLFLEIRKLKKERMDEWQRKKEMLEDRLSHLEGSIR